MAQCIATGCRLVFPDDHRSLWGDLHMMTVRGQHVLIFHGVIHNKTSLPAWEDKLVDESERQVIVVNDRTSADDYLGWRGVYVLPLTSCNFTRALDLHIEEGRRIRGDL